MHPPPLSFIHLHSAPPRSIHLQLAYFSLQPTLCNTLNNIRTNILHVISPNLGWKTKSCSFWLKIGSHDILQVVIPNPDLGVWNSNPKTHFWANLSSKSLSCISWILILIPRFVFWISNSKFLLRQIWAKKVKVVRFAWKLAHMVCRRCWYLFQYLFSEFQTENQFLSKFGIKKSNLFIFPENWRTWYFEDADSYSEISFLNFKA